MNRNIPLICLVFLLAVSGTSFAATLPTVAWNLQVENGQKHYSYTLTNTATDAVGNPLLIRGFRISLTDAGAQLITNHNESTGWFYDIRIVPGFATVYWGNSTPLQYGETASFSIWSLESTPTAFSWDKGEVNWEWDVSPSGLQQGNSFVPVPTVPEPSSILALAGGIAGLGGFALRRRKT